MAESIAPWPGPDNQAGRLHKISEALDSIASGDCDIDLPVTAEMDEVDTIARGVSMLAEEIGERVRELENYRELVENQAVGIALLDEKEIFRFANQAAHRAFGVPDGKVLGRSLREFVGEDGYRTVLEQTRQRRQGIKSTYELEVIRPDGTMRVIRITSNPRFDPQGRFKGALGIFSDITELKQAEETEKRHLRDMAFLSETAIAFVALSPEEDIYALIGEKLQALVDDAFVFVLTYDEARETVFPRVILGEEKRLDYATSVLGWDFRETEFAVNPRLKGRLVSSGLVRMPGGLHELLNPTMPNEMWSRLWESFRLGELYIMAVKHLEDLFGAVVIITLGDKRVDNPDLVEAFVYQAAVAVQRREVEEELRASELRLRRISEAMQDIVGQVDMEGVYRYVSPSCKAVTGFKPDHYLGHYIFEFVHPDDLVAATAEFMAARAEARPGKVEYRTRHADGRWIWLESLGNPIFDERGEPIGAIFSNRDITDRRGWERAIERMNRELKVYDHTVSHDLKSPLSSVKIAASTLKALAESPGDNRQQMEEVVGIIDKTIDRINALLDGLLEMAEMSDRNVELEEVDLGEMVRDILSELAGTSYGASYRTNNLGRIKANPVHMYQLFSNLIRNAMRFADTASPEISILKTGENSYLVRDNGAGIPGYLEDTLFMPFVKGDEGGRGLGLSIVKRIVEVYGGEVKSYNDDGACFEFTLFDYEPMVEA